ncbi:MAG: MBL fold metallo-hydrolase [Phycisphaeraceae bacterium]|nr:MAG: MBL fold metallo-hydrolase [Phycisphaeraceae bacterium]
MRYRWSLLRAGEFRLDGGSMFGLIPRVVWSRSVPTDERGRITLQHNCLLLERDGAPAPGVESPGLVLIEAGTGDKLDPKSKDLFALDGRCVLDALHEAGARPEDIGAAVVSHLHFDHAGGLTRLARPGETPDWTGPASSFGPPRPDHGVKRSFPNATIHAQRREWEDALANRSVMTRTYFADHLLPIRDHLRLADSPPPFPAGATPDRDEMPGLTVKDRCTEILPGVRVLRVPGHTWGQQAVLFEDTKGRTVVFTPDVMPTAQHVGSAYSLAYDVEPYTSTVTRHWFLRAAAEHGWTLVLDHEPGNPVRRVTPNGKGWYELHDDQP